jgi:hypothetical protein
MPPRHIVPLLTPQELATPVTAAPTAHLTYHGGHLLSAVEVFTVFWGAAWQQAPQSALITQLHQFFDFFLTSSSLDQLHEYSVAGMTIGYGRRVGTTTITAPEPGNVVAGGGREVTDSQIQQALQGWIQDGTLPHPNGNTLFFVYLPPDVTSLLGGDRSCQVFCGYHNHVGGTIFYAVESYVTCNGCTFGQVLDTQTKISSHELCEAITDPALDAWWDDNGGNEVGDICNSDVHQLGGFTVQSEWSNKANACVLAPVVDKPSDTALDSGSK